MDESGDGLVGSLEPASLSSSERNVLKVRGLSRAAKNQKMMWTLAPEGGHQSR
jgi:hypothetical protein